MVRYNHVGNLGMIAAMAVALHSGPAESQDAARGRELARSSEQGNCTICHVIPGMGLPEDAMGNLGPPLVGVGARLSAQALTAQLTDPQALVPDSIMPAFGKVKGLTDVAPGYRGRPILSADEIADVVAFLKTLE